MSHQQSKAVRDALNRTSPPLKPKPAAKAKGNRFANRNAMIDEHGMKLGIPAAYVWLAMDRYVDHRDGLVRISYSRLAELTGQTERSVMRHVKKLSASGYATLVSRGNSAQRSNVYRLSIPGGTTNDKA